MADGARRVPLHTLRDELHTAALTWDYLGRAAPSRTICREARAAKQSCSACAPSQSHTRHVFVAPTTTRDTTEQAGGPTSTERGAGQGTR